MTVLSAKVTITLNQPTLDAAAQVAGDLDLDALNDAVSEALSQTPTLKSAILAHEIAVSFSNPSLGTATVLCPIHRSVPPGTLALSESDCQCSIGFGFDDTLKSCEPCSLGQYKPAVGNRLCTSCQEKTATLVLGATSAQQCFCQASMYANNAGHCVECLSGFYCPGTGQTC